MSGELDINSLVDNVADSMKLDEVEETPNEPIESEIETDEVLENEEVVAEDTTVEEGEISEETEPETVSVKEPPKSWAKEQHEVWKTLPPAAQDYIEHREKQMLDGIEEYKEYAHYGRELNNVISPYSPMFEQAGIDIKTGVQYLLNAQYLLQTGSPQQKEMELRRIAQQYGVNLGQKAQDGQQEIEQQLDPRLEQMQNTINQLQNAMRQTQQSALTEARVKTQSEVNAFATDGNHPYFDELADEIATQIKAGKGLQDAYDTAVFANPVTRAKEIARIQTENAAKLKEKKRLEAEAALKATRTNVRTIDTTRTPTEKKGKLFSSDYDAELLKIAKTGLSATN
jgi:hypothetical protein